MIKAENLVGLDFETYSAAPLPSVGLKNYVADPTFTPTVAAVAMDWTTEIYEFDNQHDCDKFHRTITDPDITVVAHNAGFERAVLRWLGIDIPVIDSAVVAAMNGANRHLRGAAEQLLNLGKLDEDGKLLRLFAMPQHMQQDLNFDWSLTGSHPQEWEEFLEYCGRDAELSRRLVLQWHGDWQVFEREMRYAQLTLDMNERGWPVAMNEVETMAYRYRRNLDMLQTEFADQVDGDLNLVSTTQLKEWCAKRGVKSSSFDKEHVEKLIARLRKRPKLTDGQREVLRMLEVKQELGGSSLKKLEAIMDNAYDGRVYDQYVHAGAAQSLRTSGRSIQMQNLPRLPAIPDNMDDLMGGATWSNEQLAWNLRQVFRAEQRDGLLMVADYASIESRALAWLANETWKLDAYHQGVGIYEMQAAQHFGVDIGDVTKDQRTFGKVGELSCGYGAGPVAVKDFAAKMHVELSESEAKDLVYGWRDINASTKEFWQQLHDALVEVVEGPAGTVRHVVVGPSGNQMYVQFAPTRTPESLRLQDVDTKSIEMSIVKGPHTGNHLQYGDKSGYVLRRVFHGCHMDGTNIGYYKPSSLKGGKPWVRSFTNPKTKRRQRYNLYGGKLAGILTQSLCREIFFDSLDRLHNRLVGVTNAQIIGQFHDEVIVEWWPGDSSRNFVITKMKAAMSDTRIIGGLPMAVEVKYDRRYVK